MLRGLDSWNALVFGQFVGNIQGGGVVADHHGGADPEFIDGRARLDQLLDAVLVKVAAGEDPDILEAFPVEEAARLDTEIGEVAAVETYGLQPVAVALELERYMRSVLDPTDGVVSIDQKRAKLGRELDEMLEGLALAFVGHDVAVGHRAVERDSIAASGENVGGPDEAR